MTPLPLVRTAPATDVPSALPSPGRPLVLVVEDNPAMRRFVAETLGDVYSVMTAEDGASGLAAARASRPAAIVTDLMMPRMDGEQLLRAVRAEATLAETPVILLTAVADDAARVRLLREGAHDYLLKPFGPDELLARVGNAVTLKRAQDVLAHELRSKTRNVADLAEELVEQRRHLRLALDSMNTAREDAATASDTKSALLELLSREVQGPLAELRREAERFAGHPDLSGDAKKRAGALFGRAAQLTHSLETLVREAELQGGRLSVRMEDVDVGAVVRGVAGELAARAEKSGRALEYVVEEGTPPAQTDPRLLRILVTNLADEALQASSDAPIVIRVATGTEGPTIAVTWRDTGSPTEDGLSLGSAIVRHVADALGVEVTRARSGKPGQGAGVEMTATVTLPEGPGRRL